MVRVVTHPGVLGRRLRTEMQRVTCLLDGVLDEADRLRVCHGRLTQVLQSILAFVEEPAQDNDCLA